MSFLTVVACCFFLLEAMCWTGSVLGAPDLAFSLTDLKIVNHVKIK